MNLISQQFNIAASTYQKTAILQQEVAKRLDERLDYTHLNPHKIIDLGCGTGHLLNSLIMRYPQSEIYGVDFSENMLKHINVNDKLITICAKANALPFSDNSIDLVISNLMLQWCDPIPVFHEVYRVLKEGGLFMFTTFGPDTLQELRYSWAQVDDFPHVNNFIDMHHLGDWLMQTQFSDPVMDMEYIMMTYDHVKSLMRDLQNIGASYCDENRRRSLTGKNKMLQMIQHYQQFANSENRLPATYEVIYGHAWKFPKTSASNEVFIQVDQIKKDSGLT